MHEKCDSNTRIQQMFMFLSKSKRIKLANTEIEKLLSHEYWIALKELNSLPYHKTWSKVGYSCPLNEHG